MRHGHTARHGILEEKRRELDSLTPSCIQATDALAFGMDISKVGRHKHAKEAVQYELISPCAEHALGTRRPVHLRRRRAAIRSRPTA